MTRTAEELTPAGLSVNTRTRLLPVSATYSSCVAAARSSGVWNELPDASPAPLLTLFSVNDACPITPEALDDCADPNASTRLLGASATYTAAPAATTPVGLFMEFAVGVLDTSLPNIFVAS